MAISQLSDSAGVTFNVVDNTIFPAMQSQETKLRASLTAIQSDADGNTSQTDLLRLQQQIAIWTMMVEIQSNITKDIADSMKGVIQKIS